MESAANQDLAARIERHGADEIIRAAGGALFVIGSLIMAYNLWMTVRVGEAETTSLPSPVALQPAE